MKEIIFKPIGIINSPFKGPKGTPIQPTGAKDVEGTVTVFPEYLEGLKDLDGFSHIILLYCFHLSKEFSLKVKPFLDDKLHGVFSTRASARPNPIGLSIVQLNKIENEKLFIQGVDIIDGTPLLDIKPYVQDFDHREKTTKGWLDKNIKNLKSAKDDERFIK